MRRGANRTVGSPGARARAERLWQESVARPCAPVDDSSGSDAPQLPPSPSPEGGAGTQAPPPVTPSPPFREERTGVRRGRATSRGPRSPMNGTPNGFSLPAGPGTRKLRALWISAFHLGLTRDRSDDALVAWLCRQTSRGDAAVATSAGLESAVPVLEAWLTRAAGVDWRPHLSLGRNGRARETRRPRARVLEAQWRLLYRKGRVRVASLAALGAYAARYAGLGRAESHLALSDSQADALIRHFGRCTRAANDGRD